jgi:hypothetical protein
MITPEADKTCGKLEVSALPVFKKLNILDPAEN